MHIHDQHADLLQDAMRVLPTCVCPEIHCCNVCLLAEEIVDQCPLALNLALRQLRHAQLRDLAGGHDDAAGRHLWELPGGPPASSSQARGQDEGSNDTSNQLPKMMQMLAQLALRHESQLQALATQDTFMLFLQPGTASMIPTLVQTTKTWKQSLDQQKVTQSLRQLLVTTLSQHLLERMLKVAQSAPTSDI